MEQIKKKILFVSQWWPLHNSANVLCDYKIIKELLNKRNDLEIHVVCYRAPNELKIEMVEGVYTHRVRLDFSTFLYLKAKKTKPSLFKNILVKQWDFISKLKQILMLPFFPKAHPLLEKRLLKCATRIHKKESFDVVFSDYAGFDTLSAGYKLSKKYKIPYFPLFWDSLSCGLSSRFLSQKWQVKRKLKIEKRVLDVSTFAFILETNIDTLSKLYHNDHLRFLKFKPIGIPYLSNNFELPQCNEKNDCVTILFGGSLTGREIEPFLNNILKISKKVNLNVIFYLNEIDHKKIENCILFYKAKQIIKIEQNVSHEEFVEKIKKADILLNFGNNTINALPSKLLEYISMLKPIITTSVSENDCCAFIINKYPNGFVFKNYQHNDNTQLNELEKFIVETRTNAKQLEYSKIKEIFKIYTTDEVVKIIEQECNL